MCYHAENPIQKETIPMPTPRHDEAIAHALTMLRAQLPKQHIYHSIDHTTEDVLPAALRLADMAGISQAETDLLAVAAAYHDVGWIWRVDGHELASARVAAQVLPDFGFSNQEIDAVMGMIMATRLPQSPRNLAEEILADADLDVLGRDDFYDRSQDLLTEMKARNVFREQEAWLLEQIAFLNGHTYFTQAAHILRDAGKVRNLLVLQERLASLRAKNT